MKRQKYGRTGGEYHGGYYRVTSKLGTWHLWLRVEDYADARKYDYEVCCIRGAGVADIRALLERLQEMVVPLDGRYPLEVYPVV